MRVRRREGGGGGVRVFDFLIFVKWRGHGVFRL